MAEILKPDMSNLWASGGAVIAPSAAKIQVGWNAEIPPHQWQNWWQLRADEAIAYLFQHGIAAWDATTEYFSERSVTLHQGVLYIATQNNVGQEPAPGSSYWRLATANATTTGAGVVQLATNAEAQAWTNATKAITPSTLSQAFKGSNQQLASNGFQKLPGGLIIQWGSSSVPASGGSVSNVNVTFPVAFPNSARAVTLNPRGPANSGGGYYPAATALAITPTGFAAYLDTLNGAATPVAYFNQSVLFSWIALGH